MQTKKATPIVLAAATAALIGTACDPSNPHIPTMTEITSSSGSSLQTAAYTDGLPLVFEELFRDCSFFSGDDLNRIEAYNARPVWRGGQRLNLFPACDPAELSRRANRPVTFADTNWRILNDADQFMEEVPPFSRQLVGAIRSVMEEKVAEVATGQFDPTPDDNQDPININDERLPTELLRREGARQMTVFDEEISFTVLERDGWRVRRRTVRASSKVICTLDYEIEARLGELRFDAMQAVWGAQRELNLHLELDGSQRAVSGSLRGTLQSCRAELDLPVPRWLVPSGVNLDPPVGTYNLRTVAASFDGMARDVGVDLNVHPTLVSQFGTRARAAGARLEVDVDTSGIGVRYTSLPSFIQPALFTNALEGTVFRSAIEDALEDRLAASLRAPLAPILEPAFAQIFEASIPTDAAYCFDTQTSSASGGPVFRVDDTSRGAQICQ